MNVHQIKKNQFGPEIRLVQFIPSYEIEGYFSFWQGKKINKLARFPLNNLFLKK